MEEDIELLEEMKANCIKGMMKGAIYTDPKAERKALAIENLIKGYKDSEDIMKNAVKENLELKKYIRELEEREIWSTATINGLKREFIPKSKIKEIRDKAEVMDYYTLPDVIDDLNKLLEDK